MTHQRMRGCQASQLEGLTSVPVTPGEVRGTSGETWGSPFVFPRDFQGSLGEKTLVVPGLSQGFGGSPGRC